jgi:streptogramin lyase
MKPSKPFIYAFSLLLLLITAVKSQNYSLGTTNLLEAPSASSDSVALSVTPSSATWTAKTNASWLQLSAANQSGTGSTNVIFTFAANSGATRTSTLTIAGQTLAITQAGTNYVAANPLTTLVPSGLYSPSDLAVDCAANVYLVDPYTNAIAEWTAASDTATTLVPLGLYQQPFAVAVDKTGNLYITLLDSLLKWTAASNTVTTLIPSELNSPYGVAVDEAGNVYIADTGNNAIKKWTASNSNVTTLVYADAHSYMIGVALDGAGNVYFSSSSGANNTIMKWTASNSNVTTLVSSDLFNPEGVAVDGSGNVYFADTSNNAIKKWIAASNVVTTLASAGMDYPNGVAVDGEDNVYISDLDNDTIKEVPHAFVEPTNKVETAFAGSDTLPVVLPITANLTGPFAPASDSSWLTITGNTNGVVSFAFTANISGSSRTANITLLGHTNQITQATLTPLILTDITILSNGTFHFVFTNNQLPSFTVLTATNLLLPMTNWTVLGIPTSNGSGQYQFTDPTATNGSQRFYRISSP